MMADPVLTRAARATLLAGVVFSVAASAQSVPTVLAWEEEIRGSREEALRWPLAVAPASDEEMAIADAHDPRLLVLVDRGAGGWEVASEVELPATPQSVAFTGGRYVVSLREGGGVYFADRPRLQLRKVSLPDNVVPGPLAARAGDGFVLWDAAGERVLAFDSRGGMVSETPVGEYASALAADAGGGFFILHPHTGKVARYRADGSLRSSWSVPGVGPVPSWPSGVTVRAGGEVVIVDRHNGRLVLFDAQGRLLGRGSRTGWSAGLLRFPRGTALLPDGRLAVADEGNSRVQIFRFTEGKNGR